MDPRRVEPTEYLHYLQELGSRHAHPVQGFFGPHSMTWRVNREGAVYLGGLRALLMQISHPKVAQGVADHSNYRGDPFRRLLRTFDAVHTIVYGTRDAAIATAYGVHCGHRRVCGRLRSADASSEYQANDPELLMWVYATLVDSAMAAYYRALPRLGESEWETYYQESKVFALLFGVPAALLPDTLDDFRAWMKATVDSPSITVTDTAREVARFILNGPTFMAPLRPSNYLLAAGTLPEKLRREFGFRWSLPMRTAFALGAQVIRTLTPHIPAALRTVPSARRAEARCSPSMSAAA